MGLYSGFLVTGRIQRLSIVSRDLRFEGGVGEGMYSCRALRGGAGYFRNFYRTQKASIWNVMLNSLGTILIKIRYVKLTLLRRSCLNQPCSCFVSSGSS